MGPPKGLRLSRLMSYAISDVPVKFGWAVCILKYHKFPDLVINISQPEITIDNEGL